MKTIKFLMSLILTVATSFVLAGAVGMPQLTPILVVGGFLAGFTDLSGCLANVSVTQVKTELGAYIRKANEEVSAMVYTKSQVAKYMKTITKVQGEYPTIHSVTDRVVQGFQAAWNGKGTTTFKANVLTAYKQKVNMAITPANVFKSWLAFLYQEGLKQADMPISKYIIEKELSPAVERDIEYLMGNGVYDEGDLTTFGKSMNGLKAILATGVASSDKPMYKIPLLTLTDANILAQVEKFEDNIPDEVSGMINKIYMSRKNATRYRRAARAAYGTMTDFTKDSVQRTSDGDREIVGLTCLNGSDVIFATPDENFLKLVDVIDAPPSITDIQAADYDVKIFMEWTLGIGFAINQLVLCSVTDGSGSGLTTDNDVYYSSGS